MNSTTTQITELLLSTLAAGVDATTLPPATAAITSGTTLTSDLEPTISANSTPSSFHAHKALAYAPTFFHYLSDNISLRHFNSNIYLWNQNHPNLHAFNVSGNMTADLFNRQDTTVLMSDIACEEKYHSHDNNLSNTIFHTTVYFMYILIFVLALLGNGIVCYIVQSSPRMRTVTNYFIANLAIGDILMSLFCVPFSFLSILILGYWPFGTVLCHLVNYSQAISVLVSAYTLVAISVDRYIVIMWPLRPRITKR